MGYYSLKIMWLKATILRIFMTGKQNKLFLKVKIRANRGLPFTPSSYIYVHCFCYRPGSGYFLMDSSLTHMHVLVCAYILLLLLSLFLFLFHLLFFSSSSYFLLFGLLVLVHCFRFLLAWNQPLMTSPHRLW